MDVKIGVADSPRELIVSSAASQNEIKELVESALKDDKGSLVLQDEKGKITVVPTARIAYVEIAPTEARRVGFAV